ARLVIYYTFSQLLESVSPTVVTWVRALPQASKVYKALVTQVSQSNSSLIILALHCLNLLLHNDALGAKIFSPSNLKETLRLVFHMTARAERVEDLTTAVLLIKNLLQSVELREIIQGHPPLNHALKQTFEFQWHEQERYSERWHFGGTMPNQVLLLATTLLRRRISTTTVLSLVHDYKIAADFLQAMVKTVNAHRTAGGLQALFITSSEAWWPPLQYPECTSFLVTFAEHLFQHDGLDNSFAHVYRTSFRALLVEILQTLLPNPDSCYDPLPQPHLLDSMLELLGNATTPLQNSSQAFVGATNEDTYGILAQISHVPSTEPLVHLLYDIINGSMEVFLAYQRAVGRLQAAHLTANQQAAERDTQQRQQYQMEIERLHDSLREKLSLEENRQQHNRQLEQEMQSWRKKADHLNHQISALQVQLQGSTEAQQSLQSAHDAILHQREAQAKSLADNQATIHELEQELQMAKEDFGLQEERWAKTVRQLRSKTTQNEELESNSRSLENELTQLQRDNARLCEELTQLPIAQQSLESAHEKISELETCSEQQQRRIQELQQAVLADAAGKASLEAQVKTLTRQVTISQAECQRHLETIGQYEARLHCQVEELQQHDKIAELVIDLYRNKPRLRAQALPDVVPNPIDWSTANWDKTKQGSAHSYSRSGPLNFGDENVPTQPYTPAVPTPTPPARGYVTHQL
ncbi:hypothetical protein H4R35_003406, partial [Dimargaris xerosporica]